MLKAEYLMPLQALVLILATTAPTEACLGFFPSVPTPTVPVQKFYIRNRFGLGQANGIVTWECSQTIKEKYGVGDSILYTPVYGPPDCDAFLGSVSAEVYYGNEDPTGNPPTYCKNYTCNYPHCFGILPDLCIRNNTNGIGCEVTRC